VFQLIKEKNKPKLIKRNFLKQIINEKKKFESINAQFQSKVKRNQRKLNQIEKERAQIHLELIKKEDHFEVDL
jgi:predicted nuclease with TOPRIM domain